MYRGESEAKVSSTVQQMLPRHRAEMLTQMIKKAASTAAAPSRRR
jgi:hypothetical protein